MIVAGFDRPNIRYHVRPRDGIGSQLKGLLKDQPGPGIVYATSRNATEKLAEQLGVGQPPRAGLSCRARRPGPPAQPGGVRRVRGHGDGGDGGVRDGDRQARRALRRPCRNPQVDRGLLSGDRPRRARRRPGRGVAVSGARRISRGRGGGSRPRSRKRGARPSATGSTRWRRSSRPRPAAARSCCGISARTRPKPAAIATIASTRRRRSTSPRWRANCCQRGVPHRNALRDRASRGGARRRRQ